MKTILITGAKNSGKTTKLHEQLQKHQGETTKRFTMSDLAGTTKAKLAKYKCIGVETENLDELECALQAATDNPKIQFIVTTPLEVKEKLSKEELENFEVIEVAITLP